MKKIFAALIAVTLILSACGKSAPPDLAGEWKQTNSSSDTSYQIATITQTTIEIYWVADNSKALYWAGTYTPGENTEFSWTSENDHTKTDSAILASGDDTKTFTYKDGKISYDVTALGITTTVELEKSK